MSDVYVCRICLCKGVKMYSDNEYNLKWYYEQVMAKKVLSTDNLPHLFCYLCAGILYKFHKFKEKCYIGEKILKQLARTGPITLDAINQTDRQNKNLISSIATIRASEKVKTLYVSHCKGKPNIKPENLLPIIDTEIKTNKINTDINDKDLIYEHSIYTMSVDEEEVNNINDSKLELEESNSINSNLTENILAVDVTATDLIENDKISLNYDSEDSLSNDVYIKETNAIKADDKTKEETNSHDKKTVEIPKKASKRSGKRLGNQKVKIQKKKQSLKQQQNYNCIQRKQKRFEKKIVPQRILEPEYWLTIHLTEEEALAEHREKAHDPKYLGAAFQCIDCHIGFSKEEMQIRHKKLKHDESIGKFECRFCSRRFRVKNQLSKHLQLHFAKFKCLRCNLIFSAKPGAQFHNDSHNGFTKKCEFCEEEFTHISSYYSHLRLHRSEHVCTLCGASFVSPMGLKMHKKRKHLVQALQPEEQVNIHCEKCDIMFQTKRAYDEHLMHSLMHAEGVEDTMKDSSPPLLLKGNKKIQPRHLYSKFHCRICKIGFASKTSYLIHHTVEHPDAPHPDMPQSNKSRPRKSRPGKSHPGKSHTVRSHPRKSQPSSSHNSTERAVCEICGASLSVNSMSAHLNSHTREKTFSCNICGMKFTLKANVTRHMVIHTGEKPYQCTLCEKRFTQKGSMHLHYRTYHLKEAYPKRNRRQKAAPEPAMFEENEND